MSHATQRMAHPYATNYKRQPTDGPFIAQIEEFEKELDKCVQTAWTIVTSRRLDDNEKRLDGYTLRWADQWEIYATATANTKSSIAALVPAMVGYAVESIATKMLLPKKYGAFDVVLQDVHGNTRPDVVLYLNNRDVAWFDLTAENSVGHIENKVGGGWSTKPYVAEISYPSVTANGIEQLMDAYVKAGSPKIADYAEAHVESYWIERSRFEATIERALGPAKKALEPVRRMEVSDSERKKAVVTKVKELCGREVEPKEVAALLVLCDFDYMSFGFRKFHQYFGYVKQWNTPVRSNSGAALLQEIAAHQGLKVTDDDIRGKLAELNPTLLGKLQAKGLYT